MRASLAIPPAPREGVREPVAEVTQGPADLDPSPEYRVWLFNGCSTKDYVKAIRSSGKANANLAAGNLGLHVTDDAIPSSESAEALLTYLDGIMARESAAALEERLEGAVSVDPYSSEGFSAAKP